ncbi:hypothetical protein CYY_000225 [Polysphondylium violaceum]|uniref:Uncharacterized protein n=1 Tax=Polysphondylium violaceum TaxID=133409 RepID=A0A8J4Q480_9MYCE|nr:hypothetical protein CYY_000225 [Polysphondylium violaceum]
MICNDSFLSIFRNCYLRSLIRNNSFKDTVIIIPTLEYLNDNHQYLSVLSNVDKLQYNISIRFKFNSLSNCIKFNSNSHKHLINDIDTFYSGEQELHLGNLHDQVHILSICFEQDRPKTVIGKLPESIVELHINAHSESDFVCLELEEILSDLPKNLKVLYISYNFSLSSEDSKIQLPDSLVHLEFSGTRTDFDRFVVNGVPNRVLKSACLEITSVEDLDWLQDRPWINYIFINEVVPNQIPSHVRQIILSAGLDDVEAFFQKLPVQLEYLNVSKIKSTQNQQPFVQFFKQYTPRLKRLSLVIEGEEDLGKDSCFPDNLEYLNINGYRKEINGSMLPPNLKTLDLARYNQELKVGSFTNTITDLSASYDGPLKASVLPTQLKRLSFFIFNNRIEPHSLPLSLTNLQLNQFSGSFEHVGSLDNLRELKIGTLNQSIVDTLANVKKIKISFYEIAPNTRFTNTSITDLSLYNLKYYEIKTIPDGFLPPHLVRLLITHFRIKSIDTIPPSCACFKYNYKNLDTTLIPESVRSICFLEPF